MIATLLLAAVLQASSPDAMRAAVETLTTATTNEARFAPSRRF